MSGEEPEIVTVVASVSGYSHNMRAVASQIQSLLDFFAKIDDLHGRFVEAHDERATLTYQQILRTMAQLSIVETSLEKAVDRVL